MNLAQLLHDQAQKQPDAVALLDGAGKQTRTITYAQLDRAAARAAALLWQQGLRSGDGVLVFHPISSDLYVALAAIFRLGLVAMFVDPSMGRAHIERCCRMASPRALLATPKAHLLRLVSPAIRHIPVKFATGYGAIGAVRWQSWRKLSPRMEILDCAPDRSALATFTSGTTGLPKMAVRTHGFLLAQHAALQETLGHTPQDLVLTTLPIFVLSHLGAGVSTLIPNVDLRHPGRVQPAPIMQQIDEYGVTCIESSPAFLERVTHYCLANGRALSTVTKIFTGGAPVFLDLLEQTQRIAPQATVTAVYGSTEAEPVAEIAYSAMSDADKQLMIQGGGLLVGRPVSSIQVRVLPDRWGTPLPPLGVREFEAQCLRHDEAGELVVSGPHVLAGYWQGEGDRETKFRVDQTVWHRTGDAGILDEKGRIWLLGRCVARIEDEAGILYPFTVECAVHRYAQVKHAAMVAHQGKRVLALELYGRSDADWLDTVRRELSWAYLDQIRIFRRIPVDKRHNAKIDYAALYRLLEKG